MVVLNACYAADQAEALRRSVDCVVGMAGAVSDEDARAYSVGFYRALGYRYSIQDAHELAVANVHGRRGTPAPELESQHRDVGGEPANALDTIEAKLLARDGVNPDELILATAPVRRRAARLAAIAARPGRDGGPGRSSTEVAAHGSGARTRVCAERRSRE